MGKYSHVKKKYPAFQEEPSYQQLVDNAKQELLGTLDAEGANINALAAIFSEYNAKKKALYSKYGSDSATDAEYEINIYKKALSQLLVDAFEEQGMSNVGLSSGATVYLEDTPIPVVKDKPAAIAQLLESMPELLTISFKGLSAKQYKSLIIWSEKQKLQPELGIHDGTLKATIRDCVLQGRPVPPGTEVFFLTQAKLKNGASAEP
jgi:hypothetical protein